MTDKCFVPSAQQSAVIDWVRDLKPGTCLVVVARAGTGKTTTIVEAIKVAPERRILACAFNKTIERELSARLADVPRATCKTLHGAGYVVMIKAWGAPDVDDTRGVRLAAQACGDDAPDDVVDAVAKLAKICKGVAPMLGAAPGPLRRADVAEAMEIALDYDVCVDEGTARDGWTEAKIAASALEAMRLATVKSRVIDYDDMVFLPVRLGLAARSYPYDLVVVDEAQDMNPSKLLLAQALCSPRGRMVFVGDDMQAIYGFSGADTEILSRAADDFGATVLPLNETRRCPELVVEAARRFVPDFSAIAGAPRGTIDAVDKDELLDAVKVGDAILSRTNAPLAGLCMALLRRGVRARIEGRDIGKTLCAVVRRVAGKLTDLDAFVDKLRAWGATRSARLEKQVRAKHDGLKKGAIDRLVAEKTSAVTDQVETIAAIAADLATVPELLAKITSLFEDTAEARLPSVVLSSVHKAKGREWRRVFVLAGTLRRGGEEDRIAYVAITRTMNTLTWVSGFERAAPSDDE